MEVHGVDVSAEQFEALADYAFEDGDLPLIDAHRQEVVNWLRRLADDATERGPSW